MNRVTLMAFGDELEKLASGHAALGVSPRDMAAMLEKEAAFLQNVGNKIVHSTNQTAAWAAKHLIGAGENIGQTAYKSVTHPLKAIREGAHFTIHDPEQGLKNMFRKGGGIGKKLLGGMFVAGTAASLNDLRKEDPSGRNRGRLERVGDFVGQTAGGLISAPHGVTGGVVGGLGGGKLGAGVGRAADKALARRKSAPRLVQADPAPIQAQSPQRFEG